MDREPRRAHAVKFREGLAWSLFWITLAAGLALPLFFRSGRETSMEFAAAYLVEFSLSVDNLFIFLLLFRYFRVPPISSTRCCPGAFLGCG